MVQQYKKIVVPLDGSGWSEAALMHAKRIAKNNQAELILLHVYHSPTAQYQDMIATANKNEEFIDQEYEEIKRRLISVRNDLRAEGVQVRGHILFGRDPAYNIIKYVENEKADLVVMSTHGRTGLARFVFGSVARKVMEGLDVPVLLVRPDKAESEMLDVQDMPKGEEI
jgi:nucleotide-binding universal stress UspA family protein